MRVVFVAAAVAFVACGGGTKTTEPTTLHNVNHDQSTVFVDTAGEARVVQRSQAGGVIELRGDRNVAMVHANEEMEAHCGPSNFTIVQEGEEALAPEGATASATGSETIRTATAWRVHYQCAGPAGP